MADSTALLAETPLEPENPLKRFTEVFGRMAGSATCSSAAIQDLWGNRFALRKIGETKVGSPFGIGGIWENSKDPASGEWVRTFAMITALANELVAQIHDRMPAILRPEDYDRWLGAEPDPRKLLAPFLAEPWRMIPRHVVLPLLTSTLVFFGVAALAH